MRLLFALVGALLLSACDASSSPPPAARVLPSPAAPAPAPSGSVAPAPPPGSAPAKRAVARALPKPGNPAGRATVPAVAAPVDTADAGRVVGTGTAASCTSRGVVEAVTDGGVIRFNCGPAPVTITMTETAKVQNTSIRVVLDGGGKVTLSGDGKRRILSMDTCDAMRSLTTPHCQTQDHPQLTLQNLAFADGRSDDGLGGGAVFVRGGRLTVLSSRFIANRCEATGPHLGGGALQVLSQERPVYVVSSTFTDGSCANGGALSGIGISWSIVNSVFTGNRATSGNGGALNAIGDAFEVSLAGSVLEKNTATQGGGAVHFVSNDRTGTMTISDSRLRQNTNRFETANYPGVYFLAARPPTVTGSTLRR